MMCPMGLLKAVAARNIARMFFTCDVSQDLRGLLKAVAPKNISAMLVSHSVEGLVECRGIPEHSRHIGHF